MNALANGVLGSIILAAVIYAVYAITTKKSAWNLTNPIPDEWWEKKWIVVGVIAVLLLVAWLWQSQSPSLKAPSLKTVWGWTKNYGLWILIVSGIAWGFLSFVQKKKENEVLAKSLKGLLVLMLVMLFVVFPSIVTVKGSYEEYSAKACDHFGTKAGDCLITEDGVILTSAEAFPDGKYELCSIKPEKAQMQAEWLGPNAVRIKSLKGEFRITHKLVEREKTLVNGCPTSL